MLKYMLTLVLLASAEATGRFGFRRGFGGFGGFNRFGRFGRVRGFGYPYGFGGFGGFGNGFGFGPFVRSGVVSLLEPNAGFTIPDDINLKLCTYSDEAQAKCLATLKVANSSSISLPLECERQADRNLCIEAVNKGSAHMVILGQHDYQEARLRGLKPALYARTGSQSRYIAVAPKDLSLNDLYTAPIVVDQTNHRAFHAAILFNFLRDHDICPEPIPVNEGAFIKIVDSSDYVPNENEVLVCPNKSISDFSGYHDCNFEASLQKAIFVNKNANSLSIGRIYDVFETILEYFGNPPKNQANFSFFSTFEGKPNVLLNDDTNAFDIYPTYENSVTEQVFNLLHCGNEHNEHSPLQLE